MATKRTGRSAERTEVNRNIRTAVRRFDVPALDGDESWFVDDVHALRAQADVQHKRVHGRDPGRGA